MAAVAVGMARRSGTLLLLLTLAVVAGTASASALVGDRCAAGSHSPCGAGMWCASCSPLAGSGTAVCSRITPIDPKTHGTGLPFNKYSWLTTHNSFAMAGTTSPSGAPIVSPPNQEDTVTNQLKNGVRGLMLDTYDYKNDLWLCHSFSGKCFEVTAYQPASKVLKEVEGFLNANPDEVVTVFVEEYSAPGSLGKALSAAGLTKYLFPPASMPKDGADWPALKDMIARNHRLLVFTSKQGRQGSDGAAFEWDYIVETQYGSDGLAVGACPKRAESKPMDSKGQSLVLLNFFTTNPSQSWACVNNSAPLVSKLRACYDASAKRWPNYIAVDFYMVRKRHIRNMRAPIVAPDPGSLVLAVTLPAFGFLLVKIFGIGSITVIGIISKRITGSIFVAVRVMAAVSSPGSVVVVVFVAGIVPVFFYGFVDGAFSTRISFFVAVFGPVFMALSGFRCVFDPLSTTVALCFLLVIATAVEEVSKEHDQRDVGE
ncbi:PI-PLC X domain-containing protein [Hordeum vulgare]|nr:PI-PLC X domain-containing protein [Hordeum vulgare]